MGIRKVFYGLLSVWILFLTVTAFPSLSDAANASADIQSTFAQQTYSWSASLSVKSNKTDNNTESLKFSFLRNQFYSIKSNAQFFGNSYIKKGSIRFYLKDTTLTLLNCQLLI